MCFSDCLHEHLLLSPICIDLHTLFCIVGSLVDCCISNVLLPNHHIFTWNLPFVISWLNKYIFIGVSLSSSSLSLSLNISSSSPPLVSVPHIRATAVRSMIGGIEDSTPPITARSSPNAIFVYQYCLCIIGAREDIRTIRWTLLHVNHDTTRLQEICSRHSMSMGGYILVTNLNHALFIYQ